MTKESDWFSAAGAVAWGTASYIDLLPHMGTVAQEKARSLCSSPAGVYVAAFPYYAGETPGNLSLYARGEDYHLALTRRLETVCGALRAVHPSTIFVPLVDNSPIPEHTAAALAGLGIRGIHGLTILPHWGSYVFLGCILTDLPLKSCTLSTKLCTRCGKCVDNCPGQAVSPHGIDPERCLSHLTQTKGTLTEGQAALVRQHSLIWGCDICQQVCPYNDGPPLTPLPEFRKDLLTTLSEGDLAGLTNRTFREKYAGRAFTWRGLGVLKRNLGMQNKNSKGIEPE